MPLLTRLKCDGKLGNGRPCPVEFYLGEPETVKESSQMLEMTDCMGVKKYFHDIDCLRRWAANYVCPYLDPQAHEDEKVPE